jgi:hypothetical protein
VANPAVSEAAEFAAAQALRTAWIEHSTVGYFVLARPDFEDLRATCAYGAVSTAAAVELLETVDWPQDVAEQMAVYLVPIRKLVTGFRGCAAATVERGDSAGFCLIGQWGPNPDGTYESWREWDESQAAASRINRLLKAVSGAGGSSYVRNSIQRPCSI